MIRNSLFWSKVRVEALDMAEMVVFGFGLLAWHDHLRLTAVLMWAGSSILRGFWRKAIREYILAGGRP